MDVSSLAILSALIWIICRYLVIPLFNSGKDNASLKAEMIRIAVLAGATKIGQTSAITTIYLSLVVMGVFILNGLTNQPSTELDTIISTLENASEIFDSLSSDALTLIFWTTTFCALFCIYIYIKSVRHEFARSWHSIAKPYLDQLDRDNNLLFSLKQNGLFKLEVARILELENERKNSTTSKNDHETLQSKQRLREARSLLAMAMAKDEALKRLLDSENTDNNRSRKTGEWIFLPSKQFIGVLKSFKKSIGYAATLLLLISLTGFSSGQIANSFKVAANSLQISPQASKIATLFKQTIKLKGSKPFNDISQIMLNSLPSNQGGFYAKVTKVLYTGCTGSYCSTRPLPQTYIF